MRLRISVALRGWWWLAMLAGIVSWGEGRVFAAENPGNTETNRLRTIRDVQSLTTAEAAQGLPVEVQATVTYFERRWSTLFIQDATAGCYVYRPATGRPDLRAGQVVLIRGRTHPGGPRAAHGLREESITVVGEAPLPTPVRLPYNELAAGRADGRWIEVEGVVRVVWAERERFEIDLAVDGGRIRIHLPRQPGVPLPSHLLHARVRTRGACGLALGDRGAVEGVRLFTPWVGMIAVLEPAPDPRRLAFRALGDLAATSPALVSPVRVLVEGTVTCAVPEGPVFIQEGETGLEILPFRTRILLDAEGATEPNLTVPALQPGDRLRALGYPAARRGQTYLEEAEIMVVGKAALPSPVSPGSANWQAGGLEARLVNLDARVLHQLPGLDEIPVVQRFVVQAGSQMVEVHLADPQPPALEPETLVRLTGVALAERDELGKADRWRLWLRGPEDIELVARPWLAMGRATGRLLLLGGGVVLALAGWALFLWRQLGLKRLQNVELEARIVRRTTELEATNASLRREVAERSRAVALQAAIYRISEATHSVGDLPELYRQLHEIIGTLMPARNFYIALYDQAGDELTFPYYADDKSGAPKPRPWSHGLSEYVIRRREPLLADQARLSRLVENGEIRQIGAQASVWLGIPLIVNGRALGLMAVQDYSNPNALTMEHQRILTYVAGQTATAIERKRAEAALRASQAALRASQQRFLSAFASSPAIMSLARLHDGVLFEVNDAFLNTTGYDREEVIGRSTVDLGIWSNLEDRESILADVRSHGYVRGREVKVRMRDGRVRSVLLAAELVEIDGEPSVLTASLDVTEQKTVEEQLRRALAREKELGELKSNFVSLVSHEFRTPLEVILSSAEILERYHDRLGPDHRSKQVRAIQKAVRRMADMMNEVLLLGRFEAGRVEFSPAPIDLEAFLRRIRDEIVTAMGFESVIELRAEGDLSGARADEGLLGHVFTNLLSNAVKYSKAGAPVWFTVRRQDGEAVFEVKDRGCGIPEIDQQRLFQSFHRGSNVSHLSGTGLGLVIVRRCVERHGGRVSFSSREGEGTTFAVRLPLFESDPVEVVASTRRDEAPVAPAPAGTPAS